MRLVLDKDLSDHLTNQVTCLLFFSWNVFTLTLELFNKP